MSQEPFNSVISRVLDAQPNVFLQNHEGYYRHRDVAEMVEQLVAHREALQNLLSDDYGTAKARAEARLLIGGWNAA